MKMARLFGLKALAKQPLATVQDRSGPSSNTELMTAPTVWSFGFRARSGYVSDSNSDSGSDVGETNEARLIREMDLSSRHETVEYRPNPWSIARINAASRSSLPNPVKTKTRSPPKPQFKPIVEAFKKQARQGCETVHPQLDKDTLEIKKPAHISTFANHTHPSFEPRQIVGTHRVARSSPVRAQNAPDAVRSHPALHHSSPGLVSGKTLSKHRTGQVYQGAPRPSAHILRPSLPPFVSAPARTTDRSTKITSGVPLASPCSSANTGQGMVPSWLLDALDQVPHASPLPLAPEPRQHVTDPPHIRTPDPKSKRLPSPSPTPPPKKPRIGAMSAPRPLGPAPPARRCPSAYAFGKDDDLDAEWSTLARTKRGETVSVKRGRVTKPGGTMQSGRFRLPILGLAQRTPTPSEVKPRVITYLPPPKAPRKLVDDGLVVRTNDQAAKDARAEAEEQEEVELCVMDSDVTLVNEDEEDVVAIDVDDMCARYPKTRASMKAVRGFCFPRGRRR